MQTKKVQVHPNIVMSPYWTKEFLRKDVVYVS